MPYINKDDRQPIDAVVRDLADEARGTGQLNYALTMTILKYLPRQVSYIDLNEVIGVLECVKLEFYRRKVALYEDGKCKINGDVYD